MHRTPFLFAFTGILLLLTAALFAGPAAAAAVDLNFTFRGGEDVSCRPWPGTGQVQWNLTLAMNGTDSTSITTPTFVYVEDGTILGPRSDGWTFILVGTNSGGSFKSFDDSFSNTFATDTYAYNPPSASGTLDLWLNSGSHVPPAPPANITVFLLPRIESENKTWYFNITAKTHRTGVTPDIVKRLQLCVSIPADPSFDMGNGTTPSAPIDLPIQAAANSTVKVDYWIKNTGNTQDFYICNVTVPREDWVWQFEKGFFYTAGVNRTNLTNLKQTIPVTVSVYVPPTAKARENSTVSLNCVSFKALTLNRTVFVYPPYVKIEVIQFYYVCGAVKGDSSLAAVPGDQLRFDVVVRNLGNGPDGGTLKIVLGNMSWNAIPTPDTFTLPAQGDPGWEQDAQFLVDIPIDTSVGTYDYTLNATSIVPNTPVCPLRVHVQVKQVYIPIASQPATKTGEPGNETLFTFTIKNGGNFDDEYTIETINLVDWRVFLDPPIGRKLLQAKEEAGFTATVIPPKELIKAQVGTYTQTIRISSNYAREDIGQEIFALVNLTVIILPNIHCGVDPPVTDKELNPYSFPQALAKANFLLEVSNTGNGADAWSLSFTAPEQVNVSISPRTLQLNVLETKAVLVSMEIPASMPVGDFLIVVTSRAQSNATAACTSTYRITIFHLDGRLNPTMQAALQDPVHQQDEIPNPQPFDRPLDQVEGVIVKLRVSFENRGDRAIGAGSATIKVYDDLDCPRAPIRATVDTCGSRLLTTWPLPNNLIVNGSVFMEYLYIAPKWLCFEEALCEANPPIPNGHRLRFVLELSDEGDTTNNVATATVNVLPERVVGPGAVAQQLPVLQIGIGAAVAALAGFFVWYGYLRTPKVDEELYASIYGEQGDAAAVSQTSEQYIQAHSAQAASPQVQGMSDAQLEEARRIYGDDYGRK